jgi:PTS system nitrogen regulatory IIA component
MGQWEDKMDLESLLSADAVKVIGATSSKKRLFQDLGALGASAYGFDSAEAVDALLAREALGPTGVGHGVALPHARLPNLESVKGVFLRLDKPVDFDSVDRQPVDLVFGLFAPEEAGVDHLKALALVSRTMRDASICTKLRANSDSSTLHTILTAIETSQAA